MIQCSPLPKWSTKWCPSTTNQMPFQSMFKICSNHDFIFLMSHNFSFFFSYRGCFVIPMPMWSTKWYISTTNQIPFFHSLFKISAITINFVMSYNFSFSFPTWGVLLQKSKWNYICIQLTHTCFSEWEDVFLHEKEISILYWESIRIDSSFSSRNTSFPLWQQKCVNEHLALFYGGCCIF